MGKKTKKLTCIGCPLGCQIKVKLEDGRVIDVVGNTCPKGKKYAEKEVTNPERIVTSSVPVKDAKGPVTQVSVKTEKDIPKSKIFDVVKELQRVSVSAPVKLGDTIIKNVAGTDVDVIATKTVL